MLEEIPGVALRPPGGVVLLSGEGREDVVGLLAGLFSVVAKTVKVERGKVVWLRGGKEGARSVEEGSEEKGRSEVVECGMDAMEGEGVEDCLLMLAGREWKRGVQTSLLWARYIAQDGLIWLGVIVRTHFILD